MTTLNQLLHLIEMSGMKGDDVITLRVGESIAKMESCTFHELDGRTTLMFQGGRKPPETKGTLPDFSPIFGGAATVDPKPGECTCYECSSEIRRMTRMITCAICGNKRCPHATHHKHQCTNSNEPGQPGSRY